MKKLFLVLIFLGLAGSWLRAQSPGPAPLPPNSTVILRRAPAFACWEVTFEGKPGSASMPGLRSVLLTKTGEIVHEQFRFENGQAGECWLIGPTQMVRLPGDRAIKMDLYGKGLPITPYALNATDFPGFDWVSPQTYTGVKKADGRVYSIFQKYGTRMEVDEPEMVRFLSDLNAGQSINTGEALPVIAVVDGQTYLPVALHLGGEVRRYRFLEAPKAMQSLPEEFGAIYRNAMERLRECSKPISPP
ncbi:MAG: hypothetical protein ACFUZC_20815 [Chthoniobacteraceae bacterium]